MSERALCQYCGEFIQDRYVECLSCGTAHHHECFVENGKCTTYACGCVQFRQADGSLLAAGKNKDLAIFRGLWAWQPANAISGAHFYLLVFSMITALVLRILPITGSYDLLSLFFFLAPSMALASGVIIDTVIGRSISVDFERQIIKFGPSGEESPAYFIDFAQIRLVSVSSVGNQFRLDLYDSGKRLHTVRTFTDGQLALRWGAYFASFVGAKLVNAIEREAHLAAPSAVLANRNHSKVSKLATNPEGETKASELFYSADYQQFEIARKSSNGRAFLRSASQRVLWFLAIVTLVSCGFFFGSQSMLAAGFIQLLASLITYLFVVFSTPLRDRLAIDGKELSISTSAGDAYLIPRSLVDEVAINEKQKTLTIWAAGLAYEIDWIRNGKLLWQVKAAIERYLQDGKKEAA